MVFQSNCSDPRPNLTEQNVAPLLIWIDEIDPPKALKEKLFGCSFKQFRKLPEALSFIRSDPELKIVLAIVVRSANCDAILTTLNDVWLVNEADDSRVEIFLLITGDTPDEFIDKSRSLGAEVRWELDPKDAAECISYLRRRLTSSDRKVTLEVKYPDPNDLQLVLHGPRGSCEYEIGDRLKKTFEVLEEHGKRGITTERFAEALGVSIRTPKKYMGELRKEHNRIRIKVGEKIQGNKVFVSRKVPGGWIHKLSAKITK